MPNLWEQFSDEQMEKIYRTATPLVKSQINTEALRREGMEKAKENPLPPPVIDPERVATSIEMNHPWPKPPDETIRVTVPFGSVAIPLSWLNPPSKSSL